MDNEKVFYGERDVKYVLHECVESDKLVIVFSAFSPKGKPPVYNYLKTLEKIESNKLFILDDFGSRASYYLSEGQDSSIENSVIELINFVIKSKGIKRQNVITCGSSKGGFASLYYGVKHQFGHVIAGSPQVFIVDYLKRVGEQDVLNFILGDTDESDLNNILINEIKKTSVMPCVLIHVGKEEYHYKDHVKPFLDLLDKEGFKYTLDLGDYSNHADVAHHFPEFLRYNVAKLTDSMHIKSVVCEQGNSITIGDELTFKAEAMGDSIRYAWYVYKEDEIIVRSRYSDKSVFHWTPDENGVYKIRVFIKNNKGSIIAKSTDSLVVS